MTALTAGSASVHPRHVDPWLVATCILVAALILLTTLMLLGVPPGQSVPATDIPVNGERTRTLTTAGPTADRLPVRGCLG